MVCLESVVEDESELCDANNEGVEECEEEGRARHEILLVERRQRTVEGGQAKHAPNTGARGEEELGRVHTRWSTTELPESRSGAVSPDDSSACLMTLTNQNTTLVYSNQSEASIT